MASLKCWGDSGVSQIRIPYKVKTLFKSVGLIKTSDEQIRELVASRPTTEEIHNKVLRPKGNTIGKKLDI
jgi:hypothetical protein